MEDQGSKKEYQITIHGRQFQVRSNYGEAHIREVEEFLNQRIDDISTQSNIFNPVNLSLLVSLNLADELLTYQKKDQEFKGQWQQSAVKMCEKLDQVLTETPLSDGN